MSQSETISSTPAEVKRPAKKLRSLGNSVVKLALEHGPQPVRSRVEDIILKKIHRSPKYETAFITGESDMARALVLEQEVWHEEQYGDLEDYKKYLPQSRVFAAFDGDKCIAMNRLIAGAPELPPFITEMPFYDERVKQELILGSQNLKVEEFGTVAIERSYRGGRTFLDQSRHSYRDATERDIETWGIIMEPERVTNMNTYGFTFEQVGPTIKYQGGMCAAHIMRFAEVRKHMQATLPKIYDWFVNQPLEN
ncbi:MAG TPA: hypothetical protein VI336_01250 [Candidatus Saccharimonadales bacterium]|nr:hypothetical protein [Candidatus Saccharimonadales bacterium]